MAWQTAPLIYGMDLFGCAAAAVAASTLAKRVGLDFIGAVMIASIGAIGGGTLRDLLINRHPLFWLHDLNYLYVIVGTAILVQIFYHHIESIFERPLRFFDAIGLGAFAVIGFQVAMSKNLTYPFVILMGVLTAVAGGIMRDIICNKLPLVLCREIYISCVIIGGLVYLGLTEWHFSPWLRDILTMLCVIILRLFAIRGDWQLPSLSIAPKRK